MPLRLGGVAVSDPRGQHPFPLAHPQAGTVSALGVQDLDLAAGMPDLHRPIFWAPVTTIRRGSEMST
jgi:hypothetical protein